MLSLITQSDAEYNAAIAVSTMRDSTVMKTIAVLTTLFLPGTFVATFFSMTMFNWSNTTGNGNGSSDSSGAVVSPYLWVYWVITIVLTLFVMVLWVFWSKREHWRRHTKLIRKGSERSSGSEEDTEREGVKRKGKFSWISEKV